MEKATITITATTLGRAQYNPDYHQREYMDKGDIPNHMAAMLAFVRQDLKTNEKVVVHEGKLFIVEKSAFDKLVDRVTGWRLDESVASCRVLVQHFLHRTVVAMRMFSHTILFQK
jgi:hypothetical protein